MSRRTIVVLLLLVVGLTAAPATARTPWAGSDQITPVATPSAPPAGSVRPVTRSMGDCEVTVSGGRWPHTPPGTPAPAITSAPRGSLALDVTIANRGQRPMLYSARNFLVRLEDPTTVTFREAVVVGGAEPALRDGRLPPPPSPDVEA